MNQSIQDNSKVKTILEIADSLTESEQILLIKMLQKRFHDKQSHTKPTKIHQTRRIPPDTIAGKGKTLGDIVSPIIAKQDWECLK